MGWKRGRSVNIMDNKLEIFSFHAEGENNGTPFSCSEMSLQVWEECADKLPGLILGSKLRGEDRSRIHNSILLKAEEGSIKFRFMALPAIWMLINAHGLSEDLAAIARGDIYAVKDSARTKILMSLDASLRKIGARKIGISSVAGDVPEFDLLKRDINAIAAQAPVFDSETYVVAEIENLGGVNKVNANLRLIATGEKITAASNRDFVSNIKENLLYRVIVAHLGYKVNAVTNEKYDYRLIDYSMPPSEFDVAAFDKGLDNFETRWNLIDDPVAEVRRLRGANG